MVAMEVSWWLLEKCCSGCYRGVVSGCYGDVVVVAKKVLRWLLGRCCRGC